METLNHLAKEYQIEIEVYKDDFEKPLLFQPNHKTTGRKIMLYFNAQHYWSVVRKPFR